jgi:glycine cleavage system H protein
VSDGDTSFLPDDRRYTSAHIWAKEHGGVCIVGISDFAQRRLEAIVFVDLPEAGKRFEAGEAFGGVESVKAVNDLLMPVSGIVLGVNEALEDAPETVNSSPYDDGWLIRVQPDGRDELSRLLSAEEYGKFLRTGGVS